MLITLTLFTLAGLASFWGYKLFLLNSSVERYTQYWEARSKGDGEFVYLALGDSAAQGIGASKPQNGYVGLLAKKIENSDGVKVRVINISQSGATTNDVIENQLPKIKDYNADLITIGIGGNDLKNFNRDFFEENISIITSALPKGAFIADTPYFMHGKWERNAALAQSIIDKHANKNGLIIAPLHNTMMRGGWKAMFSSYAADWFHPNDRGYRDWYSAFWSVIEKH